MNNKETLAPTLRFSIYKGNWKVRQLSEFIKERIEIPKEKIPLFSLTIEEGVTPKTERYERSFLVKDQEDAYKLVRMNDFAYNPMNLRFGAIARHHGNDNVAVSKYYNIFKCDKSVDSRFCEAYFQSYKMITLYNDIATGSLIEKRRVHFGEFLKIKIEFPSLSEQQKIADCLSSIDELINSETQKLKAYKSHKKGLMQQLFPAEGEAVPKIRFSEFKESKAWQKKTFSQLCQIGNGKDHKHLPDGEIPVYGSGGYMRSVSKYLYDGESACIGRKGTIDKPIFLSGKFWTVDTLFYTHTFKDCLPKFIYLLFQNINWIKLNEAGGVPSLSKTIIHKIEVLLPDETEEQQKIASCLSSLDDLISLKSKKINLLKKHKKGLMQQLFPSIEGVVS